VTSGALTKVGRQHRDVSGRTVAPANRLEFLARVMARASCGHTPLLERARLLGRFSLHLDDFFMSPRARLGTAGRARLHALCDEQDRLLHDDVLPALITEGLSFPRWEELNAAELAQLRAVFRDVIYPVVTPLVVDATHPFPNVTPLALNLGVVVRDTRGGDERFVCLQVPTRLAGFAQLEAGFVRLRTGRLVCIDTLIGALLGELFHGMHIDEKSSFRVTRSAPGRPARLEVEDTARTRTLATLVRNLDVAENEVYRVRTPVGLAPTILALTGDRPG
jgi:polyphosphate kinase